MDPLPVLIAVPVLVLLLLAVTMPRDPRRGRELNDELRNGPDYGAMAEIEEHDTDDMLDAIDARRRARGRRGVGDELADELMRASWDD